MRSRLLLLAIFPVTVLGIVLGTPFLFGDHPVRWESGSSLPKLVLDGAPEDTPAPSPSDSGTKSGRNVSAPRPTNALQVTKPWKPGMPQWGVQIYWEEEPRKRPADFIEKQAEKQAKYLIGLGANSVSISFPFFTASPTSDTLSAEAKTPSPERLRTVLHVFEKAGFRTTLRPVMDERALTPTDDWRGSIAPASDSAWFRSYGTFLAPYLAVAQAEQADTFVIATELNSMEGKPGWEKAVTAAEKIFKGEISYDANWDNYVSGRIAMPVNHLGVDAYFPVEVPDTASVKTLVDGWNTWLDKKSTGPLPKITVAEAGIGAMKGAYHAPGDFYARRAVDPDVQATWYTAVCQVVQERRMSGVYWWSIHFDDDPNTPPDDEHASRLDFAGRPLTERAVKTCFSSAYAGPGTP
ncbi:glycoside hydrolase family 113 [Streptomyces sp. 4F14]|uniref:glycoside hydrolase family 113 n=1 Tax=Streptomyces sp. 4F14 TaxID=3394380 RepID=UPI003A8B9B0A